MGFIDDKLSWTLFKVDFNMERAASTVWAEKKEKDKGLFHGNRRIRRMRKYNVSY